MLKHRSITISRFNTFLSDSFEDVNINSVLYDKKDSNCVKLKSYKVPDLKRIPFNEAITNEFQPTKVGEKFGPSWTTIWFHVKIDIPKDWNDNTIYFLWNCNNEGLIWSMDGKPLQGLTGGNGDDERHEYILNSEDKKNKHSEFYIEVACNGMFGNGNNGMINAPDPNRYFTLTEAEIAVPNIEVWNLLYDFQVIASMAKNLPANSARGSQALYVSNKIINVFDHEDKSTWNAAREIASEFLNKKSGNSVHQVHAIGNCHIDTAWLWPYDETKRKCARSWASQIRLMEKYPKYTFVASQAQQFEWTKKLYPTLFSEIKEKVKSGQFIPIGNTWTEMDCNIPSGESFIRQFLYGYKFFVNNFNYSSDVFWLPDTFGYSAQLPQIINYMGMKYFFTQKLSWNNMNKFPHTSFYWIALDGSKVLTHFSPANTYTASATVNEVINCEKNNKDVAYSNDSLLVYGVGDGGGGPLMSMIERLERMDNVEGIPNVKMSNPSKFFEILEKTSCDLPKWKGELYFELHRGTYTSQAKNKMYNRLTEYLLRDVEIYSCMAMLLKTDFKYPKNELELLWKDVLLNQFHDVLPGSSIGMVYTDSIKIYENVMEKGKRLKNNAINSIIFNSSDHVDSESGYVIFNSTQWKRSEIIEIPLLPKQNNSVQLSNKTNNELIYVENVPSMGFKVIRDDTNKLKKQVSIIFENTTNKYIMKNDYITVAFDSKGRMISLIDNKLNRELIRPKEKGNVFMIYEDIPLYWDAWDVEIYHLEKGKEAGTGSVKILETGPLRVAVEIKHNITKTSTLTQIVYLTAVDKRIDFDTEVEWNENHKFLKVEFPFDITSDLATYETSFGYVQRPTHYNTSWDVAKFEVCGHKYADLSEYGYGIALINDSKYGYAIHENVMRLSLLRSPKAPDDKCDIGHHHFKYAIYPHIGGFNEANVVQEGYTFNVPLISKFIEDMKMKPIYSMFSIDESKNVIIDSIKKEEGPIVYETIDYLSENENKTIIIRLYEAYGGKTQFILRSSLSIKKCWICNGLEQLIEHVDWKESSCTLTIKPFQILTLKLFY